jgi:hypothetical protein
MKNLIRDKRGAIPISITVFVVGVIALFIFALVSYYISMNRTRGMIVGTNAIEKMNVEIDQYNFYKNAKQLSNDEILGILNARTDSLGKKYLYVEQAELNGGKVVMSVKYYPPA